MGSQAPPLRMCINDKIKHFSPYTELSAFPNRSNTHWKYGCCDPILIKGGWVIHSLKFLKIIGSCDSSEQGYSLHHSVFLFLLLVANLQTFAQRLANCKPGKPMVAANLYFMLSLIC